MTQDEIIRMAREAGEQEGEGTLNPIWEFTTEELERFAALVAAHAKQEYIDSVYEQHRETMFSNKDLGMLVDAVKAEREACAKVCEYIPEAYTQAPDNNLWCAAAIRARSENGTA